MSSVRYRRHRRRRRVPPRLRPSTNNIELRTRGARRFIRIPPRGSQSSAPGDRRGLFV